MDDQQRRHQGNAQLLASAGTFALLVLSAIVNSMNPHLDPTLLVKSVNRPQWGILLPPYALSM
jgi:hypothetical protein